VKIKASILCCDDTIKLLVNDELVSILLQYIFRAERERGIVRERERERKRE